MTDIQGSNMVEFPYQEILQHCQNEFPKEACGLVIVLRGKYKYIPCTNVSITPHEDFCIDPEEYSCAEDQGEVVTIVHSHPRRGPTPGTTDVESQKIFGIDWLIVGMNNSDSTDMYWLKSPQEALPLYGRPYKWHVHDCGSFIRDFYKQEFNIDLPDFYRPEKFWEKGLEIYLDVYEKAGFHTIPFSELKYGDVILFALGSHITTHGAVYIGDNQIGHHHNGRLSCRDVLGKYYLDRATRFLRHKDMDDENNSVVRGFGKEVWASA